MNHPHTIRSELEAATALIDSDSPLLDAEVLLSFVLKKPRSHLIAWPEKALTSEEKNAYQKLIQLRASGHPVSYLTGGREFWSLELTVTPDVLIPRPETELLVETALERLPDNKLRIADLGTGSGAIAIALASERPNWQVIATDQSEAALTIASQNARQQNLSNIEFRQGSWCEALPNGKFDLIVSNPPYIPANDPHLVTGDVRFEPATALVSGDDGLDDIRKIIHQAAVFLNPGAWLMLEHGYNQAIDVTRLMETEYRDGHNDADKQYSRIESLADLSGHHRVTLAQPAPYS